MASENNKRDQNHVTVLSGITDDANLETRMLRVDPATNRLLVSAVVAGSENGKILVSADDTTYNYLEEKLVAGTGVTLTVNNPGGDETITIAAANAQGYYELEDDGVTLTQRGIANFTNYFTLTDDAINTRTDITINMTELGNDATLISTLESNIDLANLQGFLDLSTQVTGLLSSTNIDITELEGDLNLGDISGQIDLSTQVTGQLVLGNLPTLADGTIIIGDGVGAPTSLAAFSSATGTLKVENGGTGAATLTGVLHGNGTSAVTAVPLTTDGAILIGDGTTEPTTLAAFSSATGTLKVANGGTGLASYTQGDIVYASAATTIAKLAKDTNATRYLSNTGASNNPAWAQVDLTNGVTGVLPPENGGAGAINVTNMTMTEDFLAVATDLDTGFNQFVFPYARTTSSGIEATTESNHPGIVILRSSAAESILVFNLEDMTASVGGIPVDNDFRVDIGTRCIYNGDASQHTARYAVEAAGDDCVVSVRGASGNNDIEYDLFGTTGTTTIPPSNTWFKISFRYVSGTMSLYIDDVLIASQAGTFGVSTGGWVEISASETGTGDMVSHVDYVLLNYEVTR